LGCAEWQERHVASDDQLMPRRVRGLKFAHSGTSVAGWGWRGSRGLLRGPKARRLPSATYPAKSIGDVRDDCLRNASMGLEPVGPRTGLDFEDDVLERERVLHLVGCEFREIVSLICGCFKHKLIVYLEQHVDVRKG